MAVLGSLITASSYNAIRAKVNKILGAGDGAEFGYGQTLQSVARFDNDLIKAEDMQNLYEDLVLAAKHQTGDPPQWFFGDGLNAPDSQEIVGVYAADIGAPVTTVNPTTGEQETTVSSINAVNDTNEGYLDFEDAASQIDSDYLEIGPGALSTTIAETSTRTTPWNSEIVHIFTVQWDSFTHRRTWANAGGKIRFNANLTGGTSQPTDVSLTPPGTKDEIWQTMLNTMGTIDIGMLGSTSTGTGTVNSDVSIIYAERSTKTSWVAANAIRSEQSLTIFTKSGSGVYSENEYVITAHEINSSTILFEVRFKDSDIGDDQGGVGSIPADENVTGTITSTITLITPDGFLDFDPPAITQDRPL